MKEEEINIRETTKDNENKKNIYEKIYENQEMLDPEFKKVLDDNLWELYGS